MATRLPSSTLRRASLPNSNQISPKTQQRNASLLKRPRRPYTFTQLITLSDGSSYTARTTSPLPVFRSSKDSRNNILWQPSMGSLQNVELDEAGKLRAFRQRFGRGWDMEDEEEAPDNQKTSDKQKVEKVLAGDSLMDLISGSGVDSKAMVGRSFKKKDVK